MKILYKVGCEENARFLYETPSFKPELKDVLLRTESKDGKINYVEKFNKKLQEVAAKGGDRKSNLVEAILKSLDKNETTQVTIGGHEVQEITEFTGKDEKLNRPEFNRYKKYLEGVVLTRLNELDAETDIAPEKRPAILDVKRDAKRFGLNVDDLTNAYKNDTITENELKERVRTASKLLAVSKKWKEYDEGRWGYGKVQDEVLTQVTGIAEKLLEPNKNVQEILAYRIETKFKEWNNKIGGSANFVNFGKEKTSRGELLRRFTQEIKLGSAVRNAEIKAKSEEEASGEFDKHLQEGKGALESVLKSANKLPDISDDHRAQLEDYLGRVGQLKAEKGERNEDDFDDLADEIEDFIRDELKEDVRRLDDLRDDNKRKQQKALAQILDELDDTEGASNAYMNAQSERASEKKEETGSPEAKLNEQIRADLKDSEKQAQALRVAKDRFYQLTDALDPHSLEYQEVMRDKSSYLERMTDTFLVMNSTDTFLKEAEANRDLWDGENEDFQKGLGKIVEQYNDMKGIHGGVWNPDRSGEKFRQEMAIMALSMIITAPVGGILVAGGKLAMRVGAGAANMGKGAAVTAAALEVSKDAGMMARAGVAAKRAVGANTKVGRKFRGGMDAKKAQQVERATKPKGKLVQLRNGTAEVVTNATTFTLVDQQLRELGVADETRKSFSERFQHNLAMFATLGIGGAIGNAVAKTGPAWKKIGVTAGADGAGFAALHVYENGELDGAGEAAVLGALFGATFRGLQGAMSKEGFIKARDGMAKNLEKAGFKKTAAKLRSQKHTPDKKTETAKLTKDQIREQETLRMMADGAGSRGRFVADGGKIYSKGKDGEWTRAGSEGKDRILTKSEIGAARVKIGEPRLTPEQREIARKKKIEANKTAEARENNSNLSPEKAAQKLEDLSGEKVTKAMAEGLKKAHSVPMRYKTDGKTPTTGVLKEKGLIMKKAGLSKNQRKIALQIQLAGSNVNAKIAKELGAVKFTKEGKTFFHRQEGGKDVVTVGKTEFKVGQKAQYDTKPRPPRNSKEEAAFKDSPYGQGQVYKTENVSIQSINPKDGNMTLVNDRGQKTVIDIGVGTKRLRANDTGKITAKPKVDAQVNNPKSSTSAVNKDLEVKEVSSITNKKGQTFNVGDDIYIKGFDDPAKVTKITTSGGETNIQYSIKKTYAEGGGTFKANISPEGVSHKPVTFNATELRIPTFLRKKNVPDVEVNKPKSSTSAVNKEASANKLNSEQAKKLEELEQAYIRHEAQLTSAKRNFETRDTINDAGRIKKIEDDLGVATKNFAQTSKELSEFKRTHGLKDKALKPTQEKPLDKDIAAARNNPESLKPESHLGLAKDNLAKANKNVESSQKTLSEARLNQSKVPSEANKQAVKEAESAVNASREAQLVARREQAVAELRVLKEKPLGVRNFLNRRAVRKKEREIKAIDKEIAKRNKPNQKVQKQEQVVAEAQHNVNMARRDFELKNRKYLQTDKGGNIIYKKNGQPKIKLFVGPKNRKNIKNDYKAITNAQSVANRAEKKLNRIRTQALKKAATATGIAAGGIGIAVTPSVAETTTVTESGTTTPTTSDTTLESVQVEPVQVEPVQVEPVQVEPVQVEKGNSLSSIARKYQNADGSSAKWNELYAANRDLIGGNPDLIMPGVSLEIPEGWTLKT